MKKLAELFEKAGMKNVTNKPYSGGAAARHIGLKIYKWEKVIVLDKLKLKLLYADFKGFRIHRKRT